MVGKASGGLRTSSLTSLVPRQVMLESCAVVAASGGRDKLAEKRSKKRRKGEQEEKRSSPLARAPLLRAIASFLESGGFTRTLAALRSEAQLEIDDGSKAPVVDLEEIICNYLESSKFSKDAVAGNIAGPEEQYAQNKAPMEEEEGIRDHSEEPISKKTKKKANGGDHNVKTESEKSACDNGMAECHLESKDPKREKSKKSSKETIKYVSNENLLTMAQEKPENLIRIPENVSSMLGESNIRSKEKRKKNKVATDSPRGVDSQDGLKTSQEEKGKSKESVREGIRDHSEEPISKKKKKKANGGDHNVKTDSEKSACDNGMAECHLESKDPKRKKSKKSSKETINYVGNENLLRMVEEKSENLIHLPENVSSMLDESNIRSKEKRKKNKVATDSPRGVDGQDVLKTSQEEKGKSKESGRKTDSQMPTIATENATSENPMREDNPKSKDKKKRNHNLIVERSSGCGVELQHGIKMDGGKKGKSVGDDVEADAKGSNPNIENIPSSPKTVNIDKKAKKRKRSAAEETELHVDNAAAVQESKQDLKEGKNKAETQKLDDSLLNSELHASGKKKKSESEGNSEKSANTPANKESKVPWDGNGTLAISGSLGNNQQEGNGPLKSKKAELKHSAERNTVNAFQRVKIDQVKFADERLQDNSYWAKDGAESGYGSKAQEILGQVRGRDFRHEKTKKKRGSYRGGQIDFRSHSVKFKYSDDEE